MTTYVQARDTLVTKIDDALMSSYPTLKVFWENTTEVDTNTVGNNFVQVEVNFQDSVDTTIAADFMVTGEVNFRLFYKQGQGSRQALALFDFLTSLMASQIVSGVTLLTPRPGRKDTSRGWASFDLNCPFFFRST